MSSRLSVPVSKLTRSISTTPSIARPSHILNNGSKSAAVQAGRIRQTKVASAAEDAAEGASVPARSHSTSTSPHRPTLSPNRTIPLMQGFRTSAPKPARADTSTMDFARFPDLRALDDAASLDPYAYIRVPLLPDNDSPAPGARRPEVVDAPLPRPVISVVAANPDQVLPAALTEVEWSGISLRFTDELHRPEPEPAQGMVRDIWKGLLDDVFGQAGEKKLAV